MVTNHKIYTFTIQSVFLSYTQEQKHPQNALPPVKHWLQTSSYGFTVQNSEGQCTVREMLGDEKVAKLG